MNKKSNSWLVESICIISLILIMNATANAVPFKVTLPDSLGVPGYGMDGGAVKYVVDSPGPSLNGQAKLSFDLIGYHSVDGNYGIYTDTFKLTINGKMFFKGGFCMGGNGNTFIDYIASGVSFSTHNNGWFQGGITHFIVPHTLLKGKNIYIFDYGVMQGLNDEGWGIKSVTITADVKNNTTTVPEPATILLCEVGLSCFVGLNFIRNLKRIKNSL